MEEGRGGSDGGRDGGMEGGGGERERARALVKMNTRQQRHEMKIGMNAAKKRIHG